MSMNDVVRKVRTIAPSLAAAIAETNPISSILYTLITQIFGAKANDPNDLLTKINADPEAAIKLKKIEYDHQESLKSLDAQDRESARNREIEMTKLTGKPDIVAHCIAVLTVLGFFIMSGLQIFYPSFLQDKSNIQTALVTGFLLVLHYYF